MKINHKVNIFLESKKWLNKNIFSSQKNLNSKIYNLSKITLRKAFKLSKYKKAERINTNINVILANDNLLRKLNSKYLKKNKSTNVLSFPNDSFQKDKNNFLGEIYLAYETCVKESEKMKIKEIDRLSHLIVHGTLHLLGFEHKKKKERIRMEMVENKILNFFKIRYY